MQYRFRGRSINRNEEPRECSLPPPPLSLSFHSGMRNTASSKRRARATGSASFPSIARYRVDFAGLLRDRWRDRKCLPRTFHTAIIRHLTFVPVPIDWDRHRSSAVSSIAVNPPAYYIYYVTGAINRRRGLIPADPLCAHFLLTRGGTLSLSLSLCSCRRCAPVPVGYPRFLPSSSRRSRFYSRVAPISGT